MLMLISTSMCRRIAVPLALFLLATPLPLAAQEPPASPLSAADQYAAEGYSLVWADEFDQNGKPDPAKWTYERGFVRNEEAQWYQEENANCSNGMLVIEARREKVRNPRYRPGSRNWQTSREFAEYTSSCLITEGLHSWKHGRFEMRGRIDTRAGIWPAWWTLGIEGRWPAGGEIDIMEYYRNMLLANVAWQGRQPDGRRFVRWDDLKLPLNELGDNWSNQFHIWRMEWDEMRIELSVDGRVLNTTDLKDAVNPDGTQPTQPFQQPHYMLLNMAIGGANGGDPSATEFPARFEVDYVRVYQRQPPPQSQAPQSQAPQSQAPQSQAPQAPQAPQSPKGPSPHTSIPDPQPAKSDLLIGTHPSGLQSLATDSIQAAVPICSRSGSWPGKGTPHD